MYQAARVDEVDGAVCRGHEDLSGWVLTDSRQDFRACQQSDAPVRTSTLGFLTKVRCSRRTRTSHVRWIASGSLPLTMICMRTAP